MSVLYGPLFRPEAPIYRKNLEFAPLGVGPDPWRVSIVERLGAAISSLRVM
jgi:hypothetical protein